MTMRPSNRRLLALIAWYCLAALILLCLPLLEFKAPWWDIRLRLLAPIVLLLGAYAASALAVLALVRSDGLGAAARAFGITLSVSCLFLALMLVVRFEPTLVQLLATLAAAFVLIPLSVTAAGVRTAGVIALGFALLAIAGFSVHSVQQARRIVATLTESNVKTAFYNVRMVSRKHVVSMPAARGGGLDHLGDEVLLSEGGGGLYVLSFGANDAIEARELPTRVPLNREEFVNRFGGAVHASPPVSKVSSHEPPRVQTWRFRVADIFTQADGDVLRIFASHHYWKADEGCFVVRVSMIEGSLGALDESLREGEWRTLYESAPCIPLTGDQRILGSNPFPGEEIGGRMGLLDGDTLLLTLGDHGFSGIESRRAFSQDAEAAYGKTIRIDINTQASEIYTIGHRNPQGLYVAEDGRVWLTEHGAQGGDEVNLLSEGANYGWPLVTYGAEYGEFAWPFNQRQGRHEGFAPPAYAWVPGIGVSSIVGVERDLFGVWRGDLIAGSLATRSLYRMVIEGDRIVLAEPILIGERVRDILELNDGRLLLWTDEAALVTLEPAVGMSGAISFAARCSGCHVAVDGISHRIGPDLYQIVGRSIASASGFNAYSAALRAKGGKWTKERLDAFLRDPQSLAPGTTMAFGGVKDDAERTALIEHLQTLTNPPRR